MNQIELSTTPAAQPEVNPSTVSHCRTVDVDFKAMEISCVDLISKLENCLAKSQEMAPDDFIDESAGIARKMLSLLTKFNEQYFSGEASDQSNQELARAMTVTLAYDEVLKTRPFVKSMVRMFWNVDESQEIKASHAQIGAALVRSCAVTFYHTVMLIGVDSDFGREIDQSTSIFVEQLKQTWSK